MANMKIMTLTAMLAIGAALTATAPASAAPLSPAAGGKDITAGVDATSSLIEVQRWRRGGRGYYYGGAGFASGLIIGSAIASPYYSRPYYYGPPPYAYGPAPYAAGDPVAYCMQRFRSYDPYSRTYMGYDGYRHPCP